MIDEIKKLLEKAAIQAGISNPIVKLEHPEDIKNGDFSCNIAMMYAKQLKIAPKALAEKIIEESLKNKPEEVSSIQIAGPGFINIYLSEQAISKNTLNAISQKENFGRQEIGKGKKVLVEYSSPNIAKPFTVGHLRSTIIGDAVANILDFLGYKVYRDNHLGDWGTQFGKLLYAIETWSSWEEVEKSEDPIKTLVDLYVKFNDKAEKEKGFLGKIFGSGLEKKAREQFLNLEESLNDKSKNQDVLAKWKKSVEISKKEFQKIYDVLGVKFDPARGDTELGESFFVRPEMIQPVMKELREKNLLKESEGAQVVFFENNKYPPAIIEKSDGTSIYAVRDLATDLYRKNTYGENLTVINEVGSEQSLYFKQLYEIEKMLGWYKEGERVHVAHGLYRLKEGKMSTRKGNVIWLKDIIAEAEKRASVINEESARQVAVGAIKFNDLKRDSANDIVFDWDEMMNMTGDSGPYLQYSCVRAEAVLVKAKEKGLKADTSSRPENKTLDALERNLIHFPEVVAFAGASYKPNIIATYLMEVAGLFNSFYAQNPIADEKDPSAPYKIAVTEAFVNIMRNGLRLLGISVPKKM